MLGTCLLAQLSAPGQLGHRVCAENAALELPQPAGLASAEKLGYYMLQGLFGSWSCLTIVGPAGMAQRVHFPAFLNQNLRGDTASSSNPNPIDRKE
eukprot:scaffold145326_cov17-Tisochrysis_lutea.AAC.2